MSTAIQAHTGATQVEEVTDLPSHTVTVVAGQESFLVRAHLAGLAWDLLVDTGATVSLLDWERVRQECPALISHVVPSKARLKMADGQGMPNYGQVTLSARLGDITTRVTFVMTSVAGLQGILGMDVLGKGILDMVRGQFTLGTCTVQLQRRGVAVHAIAAEEVLLPSESAQYVKTLTPCFADPSWILEPDRAWGATTGIMCPRAVVTRQQRPGVFLVNPTRDAVVVKAGTRLGTWEGVAAKEDPAVEGAVRVADSGRTLPKAKAEEVPEHLRGMVTDDADLSGEEQERLNALLIEYQDCFVGGAYGLGCTHVETHEIPTGDARPIKQPARIVAFKKREAVDDLVKSQLEQGLIEPSTSPWSSPVVLVPKKDGTTRFCVDYRKLNEVTVKDAFPLPRIDILVDYLARAKYFCTLDAAQGYNQVEVRPEDRAKTAFTTGYQLYQYTKMPFGLTNAPATFQRLMQKVLVGIQPGECLAYLDDVLVYGTDFQSTLHRLQHVLERMRAAGLRLKPKKCRLFAPQTEYLGHIVSERGIATDPEKVRAVQEWPRPTTVTEVRAFVGFCNYYRQYLEHFSEKAEPLVDLTRKAVPFQWGPPQDKAFDDLRHALCTAPTLAFPREDSMFVLDTDASDTAIGGVLSQIQDGEERPIAFGSQCLSSTQRNYCTTKKELLAVVVFCQKWKHYLRHAEFLLRTDHSSLRWLTNFKECEGMLARWLLILSGFNFKIEHRPGKLHVNADALSRLRKCPREDCPTCGESKDGPVCVVAVVDFSALRWTSEELAEAQARDPDLAKARQWVTDEQRPSWEEATQTLGPSQMCYWYQYKRLEMKDGVLYRKGKLANGEEVEQMCAPAKCRRQLLTMLHDQPMSGHMGYNKTLWRCKQRFWWPYMSQDVQMWIAHCEACARRATKPPRQGLLEQDFVTAPGDRVAVDVAGPLVESKSGNRFILVFTDYFTKWSEAVATRDHTTDTVVRQFKDVWITRYGPPTNLHSDQGREFEAHVFQEVCRLLKINKTRTCPYSPQSNGQVERHNRTIGNMLSKVLVELDREDWDSYLQDVMMAYRTTVHASTGYTPAMMHLGREIVVPLDLVYGKPDPGESAPTCEGVYAHWQVERLRRAYQKVRDHLKAVARSTAVRYDREVKVKSFELGSWVWLYYPPYAHKKLELKYVGPLQVVHKVKGNVYVVRHKDTGRCKAVHINYLRPAKTGQEKPDWMVSDFPPAQELEPLDVTDAEQGQGEGWIEPGAGKPPPELKEPMGDPLAIFRQTPDPNCAEEVIGEDLAREPLGDLPVPDGELNEFVPGPTVTRSGRRTKLPNRFAGFELYPVVSSDSAQ